MHVNAINISCSPITTRNLANRNLHIWPDFFGVIEMDRVLYRFRASGIHLALSTAVAILVAVLVFMVWYPSPLSLASGVHDIFILILIVDVVLGPLITLVIFDPRKKELRRDLAIVAILQISALLYGLHAVYTARPVYIVFVKDRFDLVFANDFSEKTLAEARLSDYRRLPIWGPELISAQPPNNIEESNEVMFIAVSGGPDLQHLPKYYVPYPTLRNEVINRLQPLTGLRDLNKDKTNVVDSLINKYSSEQKAVGFLPLRGRTQDLVVVVEPATGETLEMVDLKPW